MSQVYYNIRRRQDTPNGGSNRAGRVIVSKLCPARFARTIKASDSKSFAAMQYCPKDSTSW